MKLATISIIKAENWKKKLTSGHIITSVVAAIRVFPVLDLPVTNHFSSVKRIGVVAPCFRAGNNVRLSVALMALLHHWKNEVLKLLDSIGVEYYVVEM